MRRGRADNSIARGGMVSLAAWLAVMLAGAGAAGPCAGDRCPVPNARSEAPPQAVVRIVNVRGTVRCYGSGTVVSTEGLGPAAATPQGAGASGAERPDNVGQVGDLTGWDVVLTCAHLFRQGVGRVTVALADGRQCEAALLAADPTWDLAALRIAHSGVRPVAIADDYPRPGEPLRSCGYGPDGRYGCNRGRALGYARVDGAEGSETLSLSGAARPSRPPGPRPTG
ncbi:MAG: serine protease, partial [Thermoguttaceae bacterium]|nr:serine protease [Thermoguttaceae bacterium]